MIACHHGLQFGVGTEDDARFAGDILHARVGASWFLPVRSNVPSLRSERSMRLALRDTQARIPHSVQDDTGPSSG